MIRQLRKTLGVLCISLVLLSSQAFAAASEICGVDDYSPLKTKCQSGCRGPMGQTPCCKPPPYRPCICDYITYIELPTTIVYTYPESVYSQSADAGFGSNQIIIGNYTIVSMNPQWVMLFGYGIATCSMIPLQGRVLNGIGLSSSKSSDESWRNALDGGHIDALKDLPRSLTRLTPTKVEDRVLAASYELFYRAMKDNVSSPESYMFSFSPYADSCFPVLKKNHQLLALAAKEETIYPGLHDFLNRFQVSTSSQESDVKDEATSDSGFYSRTCNDEGKAFKSRPVYFVYEKYHGDVLKGQVDACK